MVYVTNFTQWANQMYTEFWALNKPYIKTFWDRDSAVIINTKTGKSGFSRRCPDDAPDSVIGIAVAYARYLGVEIPKTGKITTLNKLPKGAAFVTGEPRTIIYRVVGTLPNNEKRICCCTEDGEVFILPNEKEVITFI